MAHDVFISHSTKDRPIAEAVCAMFEQRGIRCWIAQRDILPGADWGETIIDAISGSRVMIVILSRNANESAQVKREVERAVNRDVIVIPFRVENIPLSKALEFHISTMHWMDALTPPLEQHIHRLADRVKALLPKPHNSGPGTQPWGAPPSSGATELLPDRSFPPDRSIPPPTYSPSGSPYGQGPAPAPYPPRRPSGTHPTAAPFAHAYAGPKKGSSKARTAVIVGAVAALTGFIGVGLIIGPFAIYLGNQELKAIRAGQSPPSGQGLATVAVICGWCGVGLGILFFVGFVSSMLGIIK
jgi:hypothetical protein